MSNIRKVAQIIQGIDATDGDEHKSAYMVVLDSEPESINIRYKYLSGAIYNVGTGTMRFDGPKGAIDNYAIRSVPVQSRCYTLTVPKADPIAH